MGFLLFFNANGRVHKCGSPCEHSLQRLCTTTPIGCEHSAWHLFTRREAVVHKWWRGSVFRLAGKKAKCINIQSLYKYAKQRLWECCIWDETPVWLKIRDFFALHLYEAGYQLSTSIYKSIRTCTNTSFGQFDERWKNYDSLQNKQKKANKPVCPSIIFVCNPSCKKRIENRPFPISALLGSQSVLHQLLNQCFIKCSISASLGA